MEERVVFPLLETAERGKELGTSLFDRYEIWPEKWSGLQYFNLPRKDIWQSG
jgi:hypothetical protein